MLIQNASGLLSNAARTRSCLGTFTRTRIRCFNTTSIYLKDWPSVPSKVRSGLFYHPHPDKIQPLRYAVSFLPNASNFPDSPTNIGFVPLPLVPDASPTPPSYDKAQDLIEGDQVNFQNFQENPEWMNLVHMVLSARLPESSWLFQIADSRKDDAEGAYVHLLDERNIPPANRVGDADDIIASILVKNGKVVPETYEPGMAYRVLTKDGFMTLPDELHQMLLAGLQFARSIEHE